MTLFCAPRPVPKSPAARSRIVGDCNAGDLRDHQTDTLVGDGGHFRLAEFLFRLLRDIGADELALQRLARASVANWPKDNGRLLERDINDDRR